MRLLPMPVVGAALDAAGAHLERGALAGRAGDALSHGLDGAPHAGGALLEGFAAGETVPHALCLAGGAGGLGALGAGRGW